MQEDIKALERFVITLEWLLALHERHPQALHYGLIHITFHDRNRLGQIYGAKEAINMLVDLARQLRGTFRQADLVARDGMDFWVLVPYTTPETVAAKVTTLVEMASDHGLDVVDRDVAIFNLPDPAVMPNTRFATATEFLSHLKQNRQIAFRWEHVYQPDPA
jgi:hypothetical protein